MTTQQYSPNNLPLGVMMITGGFAGSIAEVNLFLKLDINYPIRYSKS